MRKNTPACVQLLCLLYTSALLAQPPAATDKVVTITNTAVMVLMYVSGGDAVQQTSPADGGAGGSVIVETGVQGINCGNGGY